jgi:hypothetical protein
MDYVNIHPQIYKTFEEAAMSADDEIDCDYEVDKRKADEDCGVCIGEGNGLLFFVKRVVFRA